MSPYQRERELLQYIRESSRDYAERIAEGELLEALADSRPENIREFLDILRRSLERYDQCGAELERSLTPQWNRLGNRTIETIEIGDWLRADPYVLRRARESFSDLSFGQFLREYSAELPRREPMIPVVRKAWIRNLIRADWELISEGIRALANGPGVDSSGEDWLRISLDLSLILSPGEGGSIQRAEIFGRIRERLEELLPGAEIELLEGSGESEFSPSLHYRHMEIENAISLVLGEYGIIGTGGGS